MIPSGSDGGREPLIVINARAGHDANVTNEAHGRTFRRQAVVGRSLDHVPLKETDRWASLLPTGFF